MTEGRMSWNGHETWYRIVGDLDSGPTPVIVLHGGPDFDHGYLLPDLGGINLAGFED